MAWPTDPIPSFSEFARSTTAVTVTFDDRTALLRQVLAALARTGVGAIVVVDNGTPTETSRDIARLADQCDIQTSVIRLETNTGSAGGFEQGLRVALSEPNSKRFWLLDDDNVPSPDALRLLYSAHERALQQRLAPFALASHRPAKAYLVRVASGIPAERVYPRPGSAQGLHVAGLWRAVGRRLQRLVGQTRSAPRPLAPEPGVAYPIPWGPYGGLLLPRAALDTVGLPSAELFLYADDVEFTYRLTQAGWRLLLVPTSLVQDVDEAGLVGSPQTLYDLLFESSADERVYYHLRNQTYFEMQAGWAKNRWYPLNRALLETLVLLGAARSRDWGRYRLIKQALVDGRQGCLGPLPHQSPGRK